MTDEWTRTTLGDLLMRVRRRVEVHPGVAYPAASVRQFGQGLGTKDPFVGGETNYKHLFAVCEGDVVVRTITAFESPVGVANAEHHGTHVSQVFLTYIASNEVLPEYLALVFQTPDFWEHMRDRAQGTVLRRQTISPSNFEGIPLTIPPLVVQRRIVDLMGHLDTHLANLETERNALWNSYLSAVEAVWVGAAESLLPLGEALTSGGGRIVDGDWIESKDQSEEGIRLLQLADIARASFLDKSRRFVSRETFQRLNCTAIQEGDLLTSRMADPIGRTASVPNNLSGSIAAVDVAIISPGDRFDAEFLLGVLNSSTWIRSCGSLATGTTRVRVSRRNLATIKIPVLPLAQQTEYGRVLAALRDYVSWLECELRRLTDLRATALGTLMTGALTMPASYDTLLAVS